MSAYLNVCTGHYKIDLTSSEMCILVKDYSDNCLVIGG